MDTMRAGSMCASARRVSTSAPWLGVKIMSSGSLLMRSMAASSNGRPSMTQCWISWHHIEPPRTSSLSYDSRRRLLLPFRMGMTVGMTDPGLLKLMGNMCVCVHTTVPSSVCSAWAWSSFQMVTPGDAPMKGRPFTTTGLPIRGDGLKATTGKMPMRSNVQALQHGGDRTARERTQQQHQREKQWLEARASSRWHRVRSSVHPRTYTHTGVLDTRALPVHGDGASTLSP